MTSVDFFMRQALKCAKHAEQLGEAPIGAVIVLDGKIIARGWNHREKDQLVTGHAEIMALRKANRKLGSWRLPECDLYVTLEPCLMCAGALRQARIRKVYYGAKDPKEGAVSSLTSVLDLPGLNHYTEHEGGILAEECAAVLKNFFRELRKRRSGSMKKVF